MKRLLAMLCVFWLLGMAPAIAHAQSCSASASGVNFGNVSPISGNAVAATETISVTCTWPSISLTPYAQVCLNLGGTSPRYLTNGTNQLRYDLFQDAGHSIAWGSIYNGTTPIALTMTKPASGTTLTENVTIYGQIAAAQPTVPTVNNASTVYSQSFGGNQTSLNYAFYLLLPSGCAGLTSSSGTFPFNASATVVNNCDITATGVAFGSAGVLSNALSATGSISAQCTNGDAWRISLNGGTSGNVVARAMKRSGGGGSVGYQLYTDAGHSTAWGDGTSGTTMATGAGTGNAQTVTVYGVVPAQTTPAPGNYSDTITATISF